MDCVLCHALQNEHERVIYRNDLVTVIVNIEPIKDRHVMIMPTRHAEQLSDLDGQEARAFLQAIERCMDAVAKLGGDEAPMCLVNGWKFRTQPHLHVHVLPSKNGLRGLFSASEGLEQRKRTDDETLKRIADEMRPYFE